MLDRGGGGGGGDIYKNFSRVKGVKATTREPHIKHGYYSLREEVQSAWVSAQVTSVLSDSVTLWIIARQAPQSMGFSRKE